MGSTMNGHIIDLLLLDAVIALLIPAATAADAETYITVTIDDAIEYRGLRIATVDALDPLDTRTSLVTLQGDSLTAIPRLAFGTITRVFEPGSGTYHNANVTVTENKTLDGSTLPDDYHVYTNRTIPSFTVNVPDRHGDVLLVKLPENLDEGINFTAFFRAAEEQGYLFTDSAILYSNTTGISAYGGIDVRDYNADDLNFTLARNEVDLANFRTDGEMMQNMMEAWPYTRPEASEYLLTAVNYDSASETLHFLAAMPVLILDSNPTVAWNGDDPYYQDRGDGATVSFSEGMNRTAYILLRSDTTYDLMMRVDTEAFVNRSVPTSIADLVSLLQTAAGEAGPVTYALYALSMAGEEIVAVDYREVEVRATSP